MSLSIAPLVRPNVSGLTVAVPQAIGASRASGGESVAAATAVPTLAFAALPRHHRPPVARKPASLAWALAQPQIRKPHRHHLHRRAHSHPEEEAAVVASSEERLARPATRDGDGESGQSPQDGRQGGGALQHRLARLASLPGLVGAPVQAAGATITTQAAVSADVLPSARGRAVHPSPLLLSVGSNFYASQLAQQRPFLNLDRRDRTSVGPVLFSTAHDRNTLRRKPADADRRQVLAAPLRALLHEVRRRLPGAGPISEASRLLGQRGAWLGYLITREGRVMRLMDRRAGLGPWAIL